MLIVVTMVAAPDVPGNGDAVGTIITIVTTGALVAILNFFYGLYKDHKGGALRKTQAEAAKATLDVEQAEAAVPHAIQAMQLGNYSETVSILMGMMNGMREHAKWQDEQLALRESRIKELDDRLAEREKQIEELERRLDTCDDAVAAARRVIAEIRAKDLDVTIPTELT